MRKVKGNKTAVIEVKTVVTNDIGEGVETWVESVTITGWLDLSTGSADYTSYNAKIQESTHVFVTDALPKLDESKCRLVCDGKTYDILLIDNPMELNYHSEIFLKYTGE